MEESLDIHDDEVGLSFYDDLPGDDGDENDSYSSQVASQASVVTSSVVGIIDYPQWYTLKADALYDVLTEDSSVACWKKSWLPIGVVLIAAISRKIIMKA